MGIPDCFSLNQKKTYIGQRFLHRDSALPSGNIPGPGTKRLPLIVGLTIGIIFLCLARPTNAGTQEAGGILNQVGYTYRHLKSYSFSGEVQDIIEVDGSKYRSTYPMELASAGGPHAIVRFGHGAGIKKVAGNGPAKPGLLYPMPPSLGFQFYRLPEDVDSAKILGHSSVVIKGKRVPCLIVEIEWQVTVNNPEIIKGGVETLWVDKANHLVLKATFAGFNNVNPTHPRLVEHWGISFQSYKLNEGVPSWYQPHPQNPFQEGEARVAKRRHLSAPPAIGSVAPDFTLKNLASKSESLASVHGRPVLIDFWATWCIPCRGEESVLEKVEKQLPPGALTIFRITNEEPGSVQSFFAKNHERFPALILGQSVWDRYGVNILPTLVLVNRAGKVILYRKGFLSQKELLAELKKAG